MGVRLSRITALFVLAILVASAAGTPLVTSQSPPASITDDTTHASQHTTISQTFTYEALPDNPGTVRLTVSYQFPEPLTEFLLTLPTDRTELVSSNGFTQRDNGQYEWAGNNPEPTLTFDYDVNETTRTQRGYRFVDHQAWSLFKTINWQADWSGSQRTSLTTEHTVQGTGIVGDRLIYLGPHTTTEYETGNEAITVVIPEAASPEANLDNAVSRIEQTSQYLDVGARSQHLTIILAPTNTITWGVTGVQVGTNDFWIADTEPLSSPSNTWIHEYTHTRQRFETNTSPETKWLMEASAEYYSVLLPYQTEAVTYTEFTRMLERGTTERYADARLSQPSTWAGTNADYHVGALAIAAIDKTIREETNGTRTFQDVFHDLNTHDGPIDHETVREAARDAGGDPAANAVDRYVTTTERPALWNESTHGRIFETTTAEIEYAVPPATDTTYEVTGPYRSTTLDSPVVVPNETLTIPVTISNTGTRAGTYDVALESATRRLQHETGRIDPDASVSTLITHQFAATGTYSLTTPASSTPISVQDPAPPQVTSLSLSEPTIQTGTPVTVTATVENPASVPAAGDLVITTGTTPIHTETLHLAPGAHTTISTDFTPSAPGTSTIRAGNQSVPLQVTDPQSPASTEPSTQSSIPALPGFTLPVGIIAILLAHHMIEP